MRHLTTQHDVFASLPIIWVSWLAHDKTWGRQVRVPDGWMAPACHVPQNMDEWRALGVLNADGRPLPTRNLTRALSYLHVGMVRPSGLCQL